MVGDHAAVLHGFTKLCKMNKKTDLNAIKYILGQQCLLIKHSLCTLSPCAPIDHIQPGWESTELKE